MVKKMEAQEWLENKYKKESTEKAQEIWFKEIKIDDDGKEEDVELEGEVTIDGQNTPVLSDIKRIDFFGAGGITKLTIRNCPAIESIVLYGNPITNIEGLDGLTALRKLNFGKTKINEIDISKNTELRELCFHDNKQEIKIIGFKNVIKNLIFWNSIDGIAFPWEQILEEDLKEIATELGIEKGEIENKPVDEIKDIIKKKAEKFRKNESKIKDSIPDLINKEGEVNDDKLNKLEKLDKNEENIVKEMKRLNLENKVLKDHINKTGGEAELQELLARIEVMVGK